MIIEISVAIIALAFFLLVIFLIMTLLSIKNTLDETKITITDSRRQINELSDQAKRMIDNMQQVSNDINYAVHPYFKSFGNLGEILENKTASLKRNERLKERYEDINGRLESAIHSRFYHSKMREPVENEITEESHQIVLDILELTSLGLRLWQNIKRRR